MPINKQVFKERTLSAVVFVIIMLAGLLYNSWSFFLVLSLIHAGCWWEFLSLLEKIFSAKFNISIRIGFILLGQSLLLVFGQYVYLLVSGAYTYTTPLVLLCAAVLLFIINGIRKASPCFAIVLRACLGLVYISLGIGLLVYSYGNNIIIHFGSTSFSFLGYILTILVIATLWINDTTAYIAGSLFGKTPLSAISPKKTWEGTIGGILLAAILMGCLAPLVLNASFIAYKKQIVFYFLLALVASIAGTLGDLLESKLKRKAQVKDSGNLMPGHGGFLDRFDSLLIAAPVVLLVLLLWSILN